MKKSGARPTLLPRLTCVRRTMKEIGTRPTLLPRLRCVGRTMKQKKVGQGRGKSGRQPEPRRPHRLGRRVSGCRPLQAKITLLRERMPERAWMPSQAG